ncbi:hypothetical protein DPX16_15768 [Anabarilius grahami]|uniref:Uncharacterized protein n=1 Tax=Anabarilius grahami TaxID=495550 RepID=A0A3N0YTB8_ANAGA|nr:hypothetical protein DPX16_15768 [Anabarilius grahami]
MSKDFDTEEDLHFFAQPYLFEPEYTDEELRAMEEAPTQQQPLSQASERRRAMETWWCKCLHCHTMPTELESLCCTEWDIVMPQLEHLSSSPVTVDHNEGQVSYCLLQPAQPTLQADHRVSPTAVIEPDSTEDGHTLIWLSPHPVAK